MNQVAESQESVKLLEGEITEASLAKYRQMMGTKLRIHNIFNRLASEDAIRHFCDGIGDGNPLWRDRSYAASTRYKRLVAPPSFLYSVFPTWVQHGMAGLHAIPGGNDWEFFKPVFENDYLTPECEVVDVQTKEESRFAGKLLLEIQLARYYNQKGELVATARTRNLRAVRSAARAGTKYKNLQLPHPWTDAELERIEEEVLAEEIRGATPRFWEDVSVGDDLPELVRGPICQTDIIAYNIGAMPERILAHGLALKYYRRHPGWAFYDPATCAKEHMHAVHLNKDLVRTVGIPYPYGMAPMEQSWTIHLCTAWMGDEGWLKRVSAEYRLFVFLSDVIRVRGKVSAKYVDEDGDHCIDIGIECINQRQEVVVPGGATIALPSRLNDQWPVDKRL